MYRPAKQFQQGVNCYVPGMQYSSLLTISGELAVTLGTPAASSATVIAAGATVNAQAVANTLVSLAYTADSPFGRTLLVTPSGNPGNSAVLEVRGYDYLMQPMQERFTGASGSTAALYGQKAFYLVTQSKIITASSNAVNWTIGTGTRLGLPFKTGRISWAKENGVMVPVYDDQWVWTDRSAANAVAGGSNFIRAPFPGYVNTLKGLSDGVGSTNNPVITVKLATVLIAGLTVTIVDNSAGNEVTGTPTAPGYSANNRFVSGGQIEIVTTAAASAGTDHIGLFLSSTQFVRPDTTDPMTTITGDPRGTYEALATYDGTKEIILSLAIDNAVNASNNGGLHGIRQVFA